MAKKNGNVIIDILYVRHSQKPIFAATNDEKALAIILLFAHLYIVQHYTVYMVYHPYFYDS